MSGGGRPWIKTYEAAVLEYEPWPNPGLHDEDWADGLGRCTYPDPGFDVEGYKLIEATAALLRQGHGNSLTQLSPKSDRQKVAERLVTLYLEPLAGKEELQPFELRAMKPWAVGVVTKRLDAALAM